MPPFLLYIARRPFLLKGRRFAYFLNSETFKISWKRLCTVFVLVYANKIRKKQNKIDFESGSLLILFHRL